MPITSARTKARIRKRRQPKRIEVGQYLVSDPEVYHGELTFKGTRIPVKTILTFLWMGDNVDELLKGFSHPRLCREAIQEAVKLATKALITSGEPANGRKPKLVA